MMGNFQQFMQQAQQAKSRFDDIQKEMAQVEVEGAAGGGMVKVKMTCRGEFRNVEIDPALFAENEKDVLEDLFVAACNDARANADQKLTEQTKKVMQELGLPEDMNLPF